MVFKLWYSFLYINSKLKKKIQIYKQVIYTNIILLEWIEVTLERITDIYSLIFSNHVIMDSSYSLNILKILSRFVSLLNSLVISQKQLIQYETVIRCMGSQLGTV